MFGIDHSSTGGTVEALAEKHGSDNLSVIILDSHSDFLPMELRYGMIKHQRETSEENLQTNLTYDPFRFRRPESYNAGSFVFHLLKERILSPERIVLAGVSDHPPSSSRYKDPLVSRAIDFYNDMEHQGIRIITKEAIKRKTRETIHSLFDKISTKYLYLSIDIDIGAIAALYGARQILEPPIVGLNVRELYQTIDTIRKCYAEKKMELAGLDLMETDVYKAGMPLRSGRADRTYEIEANILRKLLCDEPK